MYSSCLFFIGNIIMEKHVFLNPDYHFKNDNDRIVLYSKKRVSFDSNKDWESFIHPLQAQILATFSHGKSLAECSAILAERFGIPVSKVEEILRPYMNNPEPFYTEIQSQKIWFPKNILIDSADAFPQPLSYDFDEQALHCDTDIDLSPDRMHKAPHRIVFVVTNKCVTFCNYCYADKTTHYDELSTEQILRFIDEAHKLNVCDIDLIGGEVFCKKDWDVILKRIVDYRMNTLFLSTKVPITQDIANRLAATGYKENIQISLDSINEETLRRILKCQPDYIEKVKNGIELLQEAGYPMAIDTILTRHNANIRDIEALFQYLSTIKKLKYWEIRVPEKSVHNPETYEAVKADGNQLKAICRFVREEIMPKTTMKILISDRALERKYRQGEPTAAEWGDGACGALQNTITVLPDGKVTICERLYAHPFFIIGDIKEQSLEEIWNSEKAKQLLSLSKQYYRENSPCKACASFDFCTSNHRKCWVRVINAYGKGNWDFPDPMCRFAPPIPSTLTYEA